MMNKHKFTLVELLVALGVFAVLLVMAMRFFSGAQRLCGATDRKNNLYADARVAMDLMATLIQNVYYSDGGVPFVIDQSEVGSGKIYFPTHQPLNDFPEKATSSVRFYSFQRGSSSNANKLNMTVFANDEDSGSNAFCLFFPPYEDKTLAQARTDLVSKLDRNDAEHSAVLLDNVTALDFVPYKRVAEVDDRRIAKMESDEKNIIPFVIDIRLSLMDKTNFDLWKDMPTGDAKDNFLRQHEYTFTRSVFIGDRWNTGVE